MTEPDLLGLCDCSQPFVLRKGDRDKPRTGETCERCERKYDPLEKALRARAQRLLREHAARTERRFAALEERLVKESAERQRLEQRVAALERRRVTERTKITPEELALRWGRKSARALRRSYRRYYGEKDGDGPKGRIYFPLAVIEAIEAGELAPRNQPPATATRRRRNGPGEAPRRKRERTP
jgi:hypothetical protein